MVVQVNLKNKTQLIFNNTVTTRNQNAKGMTKMKSKRTILRLYAVFLPNSNFFQKMQNAPKKANAIEIIAVSLI